MALGVEGSIARCLLVAALAVVMNASALAAGGTPPISSACETPLPDIATPEPLPNLAASLERKLPLKVMAIGSSSTVGIGASAPSRSYPNQLSEILLRNYTDLKLTMVNRGVSGELAAVTAERLRMQVALERPTLVLWQVGTNDALNRVPVEQFVQTVTNHVRWMKSHDIDVVLVGLQYTAKSVRDEHYHAIRHALTELAEREGVLLVRRYAAMEFLEKAKGTPVLTDDDLHLNDLGYRCMAEHIAHALVVSSFLKKPKRPPLMQ
ncbi:MAG TPA: SGNH/GDSL hydrolase family protein [Beijerinckiaceae bacterium]|nr:SGNH/GDSL hydrolase family protein [Beijerinckiaceae bacterium]